MFTSCRDAEVKSEVISSFTSITAPLRVVCGTVALGMSIECPDVSHIIHLGVPEDNESYIQKSGHTGGDAAVHFLFF